MNLRIFCWVAMGLLIGFLLGAGVLWLTGSIRSSDYDFLADILTHFLTLMVAFLTAVIALWGIRQQIQSNAKDISRQIKHSAELAKKTRLAKLDAERSVLPIVLKNISDLCEERYYAIANGRLQKPEGKRWEISDGDLTTLKACIEYANKPEKRRLQQIINAYQILISMWKTFEEHEDIKFIDFFSETESLPEGDSRTMYRDMQFGSIRDWISVDVICCSLFDYARGSKMKYNIDEMKEIIISKMNKVSREEYLLRNNENYKRFTAELESEYDDAFPFIDGSASIMK